MTAPEQGAETTPGCLAMSLGLLGSAFLGSLLAVGIIELTRAFGMSLGDAEVIVYLGAIGTLFTVYLDRGTSWPRKLGQAAFALALLTALIVLYPHRPEWVRWCEEVLGVLPPMP